MVDRIIMVDQCAAGEAVAVLTDGVLDDFIFSGTTTEPSPGTIIHAIADRKLTGQGAWVVRLPNRHHGYLRTSESLSQGQLILVQVSGYAAAGKLIPVMERVELNGKYSILKGYRSNISVSRKIQEKQENQHYRELARSAIGDDNCCGVIVRHAAKFADDQEVIDEIGLLSEELICVFSAKRTQTPYVIRYPHPILDQAISNWNCHSLAIDKEAGSFERHGIMDHLDPFLEPSVDLKNGGNLIIEPTRALTAVDVNSGSSHLSRNAALTANLATADELPRQLRIRGLGGQIVVDFIPVSSQKRKNVKSALEQAFDADCVPTTLVGWTGLGHFEMHRHQRRLPLKRWFRI